MHCDYCDQEATLHLTQVVEGEVRKVHLCEHCAQEMGVDPEAALSVTDLLLGLGKQPMEPKPLQRKTGHRCPGCGMTRSHFKKSGRLGCARCYEVFSASLRPVIESMHQGRQHMGKVPYGVPDSDRATVRTAALTEALARAVADERYEEAARIRDDLAHWEAVLASVSGGKG